MRKQTVREDAPGPLLSFPEGQPYPAPSPEQEIQTPVPAQKQYAIEYVAPQLLRPDIQNPRKITEKAKAALKRGIEHHGLVQPLIARRHDNLLIGGHQRLEAAIELKMATVPVVYLDEKDDKDARALNILLNNPEAQGEWDVARLSDWVSTLDAEGYDATLTGFDDRQLEALLTWEPDPEKPIEEDESQPLDLPEDPDSQEGTVYELGRHRLICGDATRADLWDTLMGDKKADLVWTDPPYGVKYEGGTKDKLKIKNDDLGEEGLTDLLRSSLSLALIHSKPGAAWYVAAPGGPLNLCFATVLKELGTWRQTLMWVKDTLVLGRSDYHYRHEPIFTGATPTEKPQKGRRATQSQPVHYGWTPGAPHHFVKDRTIDTVWEVPRPKRSQEHPTMKPVELIRRAIRNSTEPGALIIDPFGGSGSTLIAAEQTGRTAYLFEVDAKYADVIRERYRLYQARKQGRKADA